MSKAKKSITKKSTSKKSKLVNNQKYIIIAAAIGLAVVGYFGYRSMLTSPSINKIAPGDGPTKPKPTKKPVVRPPKVTTPKVTTPKKTTTNYVAPGTYGYNYTTGQAATAADWKNPNVFISGTYIAPNGERYPINTSLLNGNQ